MVLDLVRVKMLFWAAVALAVLLTGFVAYHYILVGSLKSDLKKAQERNGELVTDLATMTANRDGLLLQIATQNAHVTALVDASNQVTQRAADSLAAERKASAGWKRRYAAILAAKPSSENDCMSMALQMDAYLSARAEEAK